MSSIVEVMRYWWLPLVVGLTVSSLVYRFSGHIPFLRRPGLADDNLPWGTLLELLKDRYRERGNDVEDDIDPDDLLRLLLDKVPNLPARSVQEPHSLEELPSVPTGRERRTSRRRWANPIEVRLISALHHKPQHGLVINRSAGGLAILTNVPFPPDSVLFVESVEAPEGTPRVKVTVRHSRVVSKLCLIGCQYLEELPWNLKVWFG